MHDVTREQIEASLKADVMMLQPLKCNHANERASFGNQLDTATVLGKTASDLWWSWNGAQDGWTLACIQLHRKADASEVECYPD